MLPNSCRKKPKSIVRSLLAPQKQILWFQHPLQGSLSLDFVDLIFGVSVWYILPRKSVSASPSFYISAHTVQMYYDTLAGGHWTSLSTQIKYIGRRSSGAAGSSVASLFGGQWKLFSIRLWTPNTEHRTLSTTRIRFCWLLIEGVGCAAIDQRPSSLPVRHHRWQHPVIHLDTLGSFGYI